MRAANSGSLPIMGQRMEHQPHTLHLDQDSRTDPRVNRPTYERNFRRKILAVKCQNILMTPRLFDFNSTWHLPGTPEAVWEIIADVNMSWPDWWPRCRFAAPLVRTETASTSQEDILKATTAHLNFKAAVGYTLTITIHPTQVITPTEIEFNAGDHLEGIGRVSRQLQQTFDCRHRLPSSAMVLQPKTSGKRRLVPRTGKRKALQPNVSASQRAFTVELRRFELLTSSMRTKRSTN